MPKHLLQFGLLAAISLSSVACSTTSSNAARETLPDDLDIGAMMQPISDKNIYSDPDFWIWGGNIIKGDDGRYYLFHSRWGKELGFPAWLDKSTVGVASSDSPTGPWKFEYTALEGGQSEDKGTWKELNRHNPKIYKFGDTYYLYFIATRDAVIETQPELDKWPRLRNNQRTGVATSKSLMGPWVEHPDPVVVPDGPVNLITVNPAVTQTPEGDYLMVIKGDLEDRWKRGMHHVQGIARAKDPKGPWEIQPKLAIEEFRTEDVSIWLDQERQRYYAIFHAYTKIGIITSADGVNWEKGTNFEVTPKQLKQVDGSMLNCPRLERPFVYVDPKTKLPVALNMAVKQKNESYNVTVPLVAQ